MTRVMSGWFSGNNDNKKNEKEEYEILQSENKNNSKEMSNYETQKKVRETSSIHFGNLPNFDDNDGGMVRKRRRDINQNLLPLDLESKKNIKMPYDDEKKDEMVACGREFTFNNETKKEEKTVSELNKRKKLYLRILDLDYKIIRNLGYSSVDDYEKTNGDLEKNLTKIYIEDGKIISEERNGIEVPLYDFNLITQRVILKEILTSKGKLYTATNLYSEEDFRFALKEFEMSCDNLNIMMNVRTKQNAELSFSEWAKEKNITKKEMKEKRVMDGFVGYVNKKTNNSYIITKLYSSVEKIVDSDVIFSDGTKYPSRWSILDNYRPIYYDRRYSGWIVGLSQYENLCKLGVKFLAKYKEDIEVEDSEVDDNEIVVSESSDEDDYYDEEDEDGKLLDGWKAFISSTGNSYTLRPVDKNGIPYKIKKVDNVDVWFDEDGIESSYGKKWSLYPDYRTLYYVNSQLGWCISFDYRDRLMEDGCIIED